MVYLASDDTLMQPGYTWMLDQASGICNSASNEVAFVCGGVKMMTFGVSQSQTPIVSMNGNLDVTGGQLTQQGRPLTASRLAVAELTVPNTSLSASNLNIIRTAGTYNLLCDLGSASNGTFKYVMNSVASASTLNIRNTANNSNVAVYTLPANNTMMFIWYNPMWYPVSK